MNKTENLKYILDRYDHYNESVQAKSNLYLALNTFIIGGSITMLLSINMIKLNAVSLFMIFSIILISIVSLIVTVLALRPHLKTDSTKSMIFFNDVSSISLKDYSEKVKLMNEIEFDTDLGNQIHCIAGGLSCKYKKLKWVSYFLIFQYSAILIWTLIFIHQNK